jgi:hypothetical protein
MDLLQKISAFQAIMNRTDATSWQRLNETQNMIEQSEANQTIQLSKLQSANEAFSKNLNDVLTRTHGKLAAQISTEVNDSIKSNVGAIQKAAADISAYDKKLKTSLDRKIEKYDNSVERLFYLDDWRERFFWAGMGGAIATPIVLIIAMILWWWPF